MNGPKQLDRSTIEEAFRLMGQYLLERKALGEIAIYGGSAILFQFKWRQSSQDVDARVISDGNHGVVIDAAKHAASRLGLPSSWLSESVATYARKGEGETDRVSLGLYPSPERFGLRVMAAKPSYILAMKLRALERVTADDRDYEDAINLGVACGVTTVDELLGTFSASSLRRRRFPTRPSCGCASFPKPFGQELAKVVETHVPPPNHCRGGPHCECEQIRVRHGARRVRRRVLSRPSRQGRSAASA